MVLQLPDAPASGGASASPTAQPFARQNKRRRSSYVGELEDIPLPSHSCVWSRRHTVNTARSSCCEHLPLALLCSRTLWRPAAGRLRGRGPLASNHGGPGTGCPPVNGALFDHSPKYKKHGEVGTPYRQPRVDGRLANHDSANTVSEEELQVHGGQSSLGTDGSWSRIRQAAEGQA
jgi:hypothetical protein